MKKRIFLCIVIFVLIFLVFFFIKWPLSFDLKKTNNSNLKTASEIQNENSENSLQEDNVQENQNDDIVGKWNTVSAVNSKTGEKIERLSEIFGSSYSQYGSYLELKEDGTFIDAIEPITNGSKSNSGKYEVKRDYNKPGDCYVFLSYSDGNEAKLQKVILDNSNTFYLVLEDLINDYQFTFKK